MAGPKRDEYRILITDHEGNFVYMDAPATTAELELLFAVMKRSNCTAELVPQLASAAGG